MNVNLTQAVDAFYATSMQWVIFSVIQCRPKVNFHRQHNCFWKYVWGLARKPTNLTVTLETVTYRSRLPSSRCNHCRFLESRIFWLIEQVLTLRLLHVVKGLRAASTWQCKAPQKSARSAGKSSKSWRYVLARRRCKFGHHSYYSFFEMPLTFCLYHH